MIPWSRCTILLVADTRRLARHTRLGRPFTLIVALGVAFGDLCAQPKATRHGVVRGVVLDTLGSPKPGIIVHLVADSTTPSRPRHRSLFAIETADDQGRFQFSSVTPQQYVLIAHRPSVDRGTEMPITSANDTMSTVVTFREHDLSDGAPRRRAQALANLATARARWASRRPSRYRLTARMDCYCDAAKDGARTLEFVGDSLVAVIQKGGRPSTGSESWLARFAVARLFAHADAEIRNFERIIQKVELDPRYGFPTVVATNTAYNLLHVWLGLYVTDFRAIP